MLKEVSVASFLESNIDINSLVVMNFYKSIDFLIRKSMIVIFFLNLTSFFKVPRLNQELTIHWMNSSCLARRGML